ncbi:SsrA-binding protein [Lutibacter sp.]|nr:SsrA-binding protein [Lutibacter sp.]MCF6181769.1 SsrA-binding protein [Lutibacter sp.]
MRKKLFKTVAKLNKMVFPSFSKMGLEMQHAKKWQLAIIGWRYFVTKNSL